ncbi:MAG: ATP-dependent zinc protease [Planctomycetales bacterium]|nr:ATP-dependent zinc protease [Planctomycetales bacterium]
MTKIGSLSVLGWREWVALPDLGVDQIKVKLDTGARSSSIHAFEVQVYRQQGVDRVRFSVHPLQRNDHTIIQADAPLLEYRLVRSSNGQTDERPVIVTNVHVAGQAWPIELTLANRDAMGFRMLLGREALKGRFCVDPASSYLAGRKKRKGPSA